MSRGGRGGARGGRSGPPGTVTIGGTELQWDLTGLDIQKGPGERFPDARPAQAPPPSDYETATLKHYIAVRDRIHNGPFYTILNDGMKSGLKRRAGDTAVSEEALWNPFTDNKTYTARYHRERRKVPKLDTRPFVHALFPPELHPYLSHSTTKPRVLAVTTRITDKSTIQQKIEAEESRTRDAEARAEEGEDDEEFDEDEDVEEKEGGDDDDNWSKASSDSEEADDDYNAEQYFDNGEDDDGDDADPYENTYE